MITSQLSIVGAGAAGIAIAREFADTDISVSLIEAGGMSITEDMQSLFEADVEGLPHSGIRDGRARVFGGTTTLWAGQALPLRNIDFTRREWVPLSGWPITKQILEPYYRRSERVMKLPHSSYGSEGWESPTPSLRHLENEWLETRFSMFTHSPNFSSLYYEKLRTSNNINIILKYGITDIGFSQDGTTVEYIVISNTEGDSLRIESDIFVLCCGGIETPRLLMHLLGKANHNLDALGKYFNEHLHIHVPFSIKNSSKVHTMFESRRNKKAIFYPKFVASTYFQEDNEILNVGADLIYKDDRDIYLDYLKRALRRFRNWEIVSGSQSLFRSMRQMDYVMGSILRYALGKRKLGEGLGNAFFSIQSECLPLEESRIELTDEYDRVGLPKMRLVWRLSRHELQSIRAFACELDKLLRTQGIGKLDMSFLPSSDDPEDWEGIIHDSYHHMGATRMSVSCDDGVVNSDCRVHGISNLFVASSSIFPTGGFSNPTLTLLALSLRLADHLKSLLK